MNSGPFREALFNGVSRQFIEHISKEGNDRIIVSGKFGIGKSFFLDHFFKADTQQVTLQKTRYRAFHLFPVNYSIAANEDIFRYLKYDVLNSMLLNQVDLEESDFKTIDALPDFIKNHWEKLLASMIYMVPKIGKPLYESYKKLDELRDEFSRFAETATSSTGNSFVQFMEHVESREGSLFESDLITELILTVLARLKESTQQENVLIIDDMDRIDPAHVFRLLNVFAAHLDHPTTLTNKLGFDKVIVVCDIHNLRSIFRTNYGIHTDFNGYIDKFYSNEIFYFDNRKQLVDIALEAFKSVEFPGLDSNNEYNTRIHLFRRSSLAIELLEIFISYGFINLRSLLSKIKSKISLTPGIYMKFEENKMVRQLDVVFLSHFAILKCLLGGYDHIREIANRIPNRGFHFSRKNLFCNQLLYFVRYDQTFDVKDRAPVTFKDKSYNMRTPDKISKGLDDLILYEADIPLDREPVQIDFSIADFKVLLEDFLDLMIRVENQ